MDQLAIDHFLVVVASGEMRVLVPRYWKGNDFENIKLFPLPLTPRGGGGVMTEWTTPQAGVTNTHEMKCLEIRFMDPPFHFLHFNPNTQHGEEAKKSNLKLKSRSHFKASSCSVMVINRTLCHSSLKHNHVVHLIGPEIPTRGVFWHYVRK